MTKLLDTSVAEEKDVVTAEHTEAEERVTSLRNEFSYGAERRDAELVRTAVAEKMKVIELITSLEEAKGAMDVLMEGPIDTDKGKAFARAFKLLEDRIAELVADDESKSMPCCIADDDRINTGKMAVDAGGSLRGELSDLIEIEGMLHGAGSRKMPFDMERDGEIAKDFTRRRIALVASMLKLKGRGVSGEVGLGGPGAFVDLEHLCVLISESFKINLNTVREVLVSIMKRTLKKILIERQQKPQAGASGKPASTNEGQE